MSHHIETKKILGVIAITLSVVLILANDEKGTEIARLVGICALIYSLVNF